MRNKIIFITTVLGILLLLMISSLVLLKNKTKPPTTTSPAISPQPSVSSENTQNGNVPQIIATDPKDGAINVPITQKITVQFDQNIVGKQFSFDIAPTTPHMITTNNNTVTISFSQPLNPHAAYVYQISFSSKATPQSFSFTTVAMQNEQITYPDTGVNPNKQAADYQRMHEPDIFLQNNVPYSTSDFSIDSQFTQTPTEHFSFIVMLTGPDKNIDEQEFLGWLQTIGLGTEQIQQLDIRYQ